MADEVLNAELKQRANNTICQSKSPLERLQARLLARGASTFKSFTRIFRNMDDDGDLKLNKEEFADAMAKLGVRVSDEEIATLFADFDTDGSGTINVTEFSVGLRPNLNQRRLDIVTKCFRKMDRTGDKIVTVEDLAGTYKVHHHRKYKSGEWTKTQVLKNFLQQFEAQDHPDGKVTLEEFTSYYACLSACIDNDPYFELMMTNAWGL